MQYASLGHSGLIVSRICLGCMSYGSSKWRPWVLDEAQAKPFYRKALDLGINFFDTADMYANGRSEELLGRFLAGRRSDVIIATKFGQEMEGQGRGARPEYVRKAFQASLGRLKTDYVDLYQLHLPDPEVPIAEGD